jgi:hypothetical protein
VTFAVIRRSLPACALVAILGVAAQVRGDTNPPPEIPVNAWLDGPERQDFPWRVEVGRSSLTFQQRRAINTKVIFRVRDLLKADVALADLHLVVKVAGEDGHWFPGQSYSHFEPPKGLGSGDQIKSFSGIYLREGSYKIAVIAYDAFHHRGNLWRGSVHIDPLKDDPLPGIERDLPRVEFLPAGREIPYGRTSIVTFDPWILGEGDLLLPVKNARPLQVDIVANVSLSAATDWPSHEAPAWRYQWNGAALMQISNVLSQLNPKAGCVRLSSLDVRRQKIFLDRQDVGRLDWSHLGAAIAGVERDKIDVTTLAGEKHEPAFLARYLEQISRASDSCSSGSARPLHVLILVSDSFVFPNGTQMTSVQTGLIPPGLTYQLRLVPVAAGRWDEIQSVVKPLHPVKFEFSDAGGFRKILGQLIADIEKQSSDDRRSAP